MANTCFPVSPSPCLWPISQGGPAPPPALLGPWIQARKGHSSCLGQSRMDQGGGLRAPEGGDRGHSVRDPSPCGKTCPGSVGSLQRPSVLSRNLLQLNPTFPL